MSLARAVMSSYKPGNNEKLMKSLSLETNNSSQYSEIIKVNYCYYYKR